MVIAVRFPTDTEDSLARLLLQEIVDDSKLAGTVELSVLHDELNLSFEPEAIIDHFDGEPAQARLREAAKANPKRMREACSNAVSDDVLYKEFHTLCAYVYEQMTGEEYA